MPAMPRLFSGVLAGRSLPLSFLHSLSPCTPRFSALVAFLPLFSALVVPVPPLSFPHSLASLIPTFQASAIPLPPSVFCNRYPLSLLVFLQSLPPLLLFLHSMPTCLPIFSALPSPLAPLSFLDSNSAFPLSFLKLLRSFLPLSGTHCHLPPQFFALNVFLHSFCFLHS